MSDTREDSFRCYVCWEMGWRGGCPGHAAPKPEPTPAPAPCPHDYENASGERTVCPECRVAMLAADRTALIQSLLTRTGERDALRAEVAALKVERDQYLKAHDGACAPPERPPTTKSADGSSSLVGAERPRMTEVTYAAELHASTRLAFPDGHVPVCCAETERRVAAEHERRAAVREATSVKNAETIGDVRCRLVDLVALGPSEGTLAGLERLADDLSAAREREQDLLGRVSVLTETVRMREQQRDAAQQGFEDARERERGLEKEIDAFALAIGYGEQPEGHSHVMRPPLSEIADLIRRERMEHWTQIERQAKTVKALWERGQRKAAQRDAAEAERDRLRERLDLFDAYGITVASALRDRDAVDRLRERITDLEAELARMMDESVARERQAIDATARAEKSAALSAPTEKST